jgi:hypothetical protein
MASATTAPTVTGRETDINGNVICSIPSRMSTDAYLVVEANGETRRCCRASSIAGAAPTWTPSPPTSSARRSC